MTITARSILIKDIPTLLAAFETWLSAETQCARGAFWPSPKEIRAGRVRYVAEDDGEPIGVILALTTGKIFWLITKPGRTVEAFNALTEAVLAEAGDCFGNTPNATLRQQYLDGCPQLVQEDPEGDPTLIRRHP